MVYNTIWSTVVWVLDNEGFIFFYIIYIIQCNVFIILKEILYKNVSSI